MPSKLPRLPHIVLFVSGLLVAMSLIGARTDSPTSLAQEQRVELLIRDSEFIRTQPVTIRMGMPLVIILRNQDIIRHGFTSPILTGLRVQGEGEGVVAYGKGVDGFYLDANKTLVIRFIPEKPGTYSFRCDLHPQMKGELYTMEIPAV